MTTGSLVTTTIPVFLSSTWLDLQPERAAVEAVLNQFRETKFRGMEYFGSRPASAESVSLDEVDRCLLYIGVFGGRYGSGITEAEYRRARARQIPCLVYVKKKPTESDPDDVSRERQRALVTELLTNSDHLVKEFLKAEELATMVAVDLHHWLFEQYLIPSLGTATARHAAAREVNSLLGAVVDRFSLGGPLLRALKAEGYSFEQTASPPPGVENERAELAALALRVRQAWIAGVLERTVHSEMMLSIGRQIVSDAVDRPWSSQTEFVLSDTAVQIPYALSTLKVFGQAGQFLLVLGEPGSGKTVTLLELTRDLLDLYENRQIQHVPVVLNLSTWRARAGRLAAWAADELVTTYYVPRALARKWIEGRRLLLVLDGLDEVPEQERTSCVKAVNAFLADVGAPGVVVACRSAEYAALTMRLRLYSAIRLQPLDDQQVDAYLARGGEPLARLRAALVSNESLRVLSRAPLMLAIMSSALQQELPEGSFGPPGSDTRATEAQLRDELFALYTTRMFKRRKVDQSAQADIVGRLSWLARSMQRHRMSLFWIESLQPTWLTTTASRLSYGTLAGCLVSVLYSIVAWLPLWPPGVANFLWWAGVLALSFASVVLVDLLRIGAGTGLEASGGRILATALSVVWLALYLLFPISLMALLFGELMGSVFALIFASEFWVAYGWRSAWRRAETEIRLADELKWSWPHAIRGSIYGVVIGAIFVTVFLGVLEGGALSGSSVVTVSFWMTSLTSAYEVLVKQSLSLGFLDFHLVWMAAGASLGVSIFGLRSTIRERMIRPNEGLLRTARRAAGYALLFGVLPLGFIFVAVRGVPTDSSAWRTQLAILLLPEVTVGLLFGGLDVIRHSVLRLFLAGAGHLPLRAVRFLDHGVSLVFLRRVGGGYVFIHRMMLEYFADLPVGAHGAGGRAAPEVSTAYSLREASAGQQ